MRDLNHFHGHGCLYQLLRHATEQLGINVTLWGVDEGDQWSCLTHLHDGRIANCAQRRRTATTNWKWMAAGRGSGVGPEALTSSFKRARTRTLIQLCKPLSRFTSVQGCPSQSAPFSGRAIFSISSALDAPGPEDDEKDTLGRVFLDNRTRLPALLPSSRR